ncbi:hypothetical protein BV898_10636 [Hypsibius exemplaris]|uniref:Nuclear pore complex protein Nup85 n=1 Tax=Hypsibius exemplaris TaxID=2072580 RepID=A0A1W0WJ67_HYPEX|nr:hypothetical protein BV898_10636 [Hypsibius exemplaris]
MDSYMMERSENDLGNEMADGLATDDLGRLSGGWMHLAKRSYSVLEDIMRHRETAGECDSSEFLNRVLGDSSRYLALLEEIRELLAGALEGGMRPLEIEDVLQRELQSFHYLILLWRLCQIVFLEHMADFKCLQSKTYVQRLMTFRDSIGPALETMPYAAEPGENDPQVWQTVLRFVMIGELDQAADSLSSLSRRAKESPSVNYLRNLLDDAPLFTDTPDSDRIEEWRTAIRDILTEDVVMRDRDASRVLRVLLGSFEDWAVSGHEFSSWLSFYISRVAFTSPFISPTALAVDHHQFSEAYGACQQRTFPADVDVAFECALRLDWDGMFEVLRKFFRNTWFTVHMWDLIHHSRSLISAERVEDEISGRFREAFMVEYSETAIQNGEWLPFLRYFKFCSPESQQRVKQVLNNNDFRSGDERADVIAALETDGMTMALQEIYRRDAYSYIRNGDFQFALTAALQTDEEFRARIGNEYVRYIRLLRGGVKFLNTDKANLSLVPDSVLERLGLPGLVSLYAKAVSSEDHNAAMSCLLKLLKQTSRRKEAFDLVGRLTDCIRRVRERSKSGDIDLKTYQDIRQWVMMLPLTNLKPATDMERDLVDELKFLVCGSPGWSLDPFSGRTRTADQPADQSQFFTPTSPLVSKRPLFLTP